jgi:putative acetyltransferase
MTPPVTLRRAVAGDAPGILALYLTVAERSGGLARHPDEITREYVDAFVARSAADGIQVVAVDLTNVIVAELHAYRSGLRRFAHILSSLTVAVHPDAQGQGIGRRLFLRLFEELELRSDITRVELVTQESNTRGRRLYESLGFRQEGRFEGGIQRFDGGFEADIPMAWTRSPDLR